MSVDWTSPSPVLVINDDTGEFVMTKYIVLIRKSVGSNLKSQLVFSLQGGHYGTYFIDSPLSPKELHRRLFSLHDLSD